MVADGCGASFPRLFVYDLPSTYRISGSAHGHAQLHAREIGNFTVDGYDGVLHFYTNFELGAMYLERALAYRCRVLDPARADLFLVPAFNTEQTPRPSWFCAESPRGPANHYLALYQRLESQAPGALLARGGADHVRRQSGRAARHKRACTPTVYLDCPPPTWRCKSPFDLVSGCPVIAAPGQPPDWSAPVRDASVL